MTRAWVTFGGVTELEVVTSAMSGDPARARTVHALATAVADGLALGPEALDPSFNIEVLSRQLEKRRGVLKSVLLNQRVLAGL